MTDRPSNPWPGAQTVKAWLKAFIPGDLPGSIEGVGQARGSSLLVGPCSWFNDCFHTDNRTFSQDIAASCRMHSEFELDLVNNELREVHYCGETIEFDCEGGEVECRATASSSGMRFSNLRWEGHDRIAIDVDGSANNPCLRDSPVIGYAGSFTLDLAARNISFEGYVHGFPAYEAYAIVNGGPAKQVFTYGPRGGPDALAGPPASDPVAGKAQF